MYNDLFFPKKHFNFNAFMGDPIYKNHNGEKAYYFFNSNWGDLQIRWIDTNVNFNLHRLSMGSVNCFGVTSNAQAEVTHTNTLQRKSISFLVSIQSGADITIDGKHFSLSALNTLIFNEQNEFSLTWEETTQHLVIDVPYDLLFRVANEIYKDRCITEEDFNYGILLNRHRRAQLHFMLDQAFFVQKRSFAQPFQAEWIRQTERGFAALTLENLLSPTPQLSNTYYKKNYQQHSLEMLEQLEAYMHSHLEAPLTINDLIEKADCSRSQLFQLCQQQLGLSPMAWLRKLRLEAARDYLMDSPELSITEVAYRFGFGHPGRFAKYYQHQFDELPHETQL